MDVVIDRAVGAAVAITLSSFKLLSWVGMKLGTTSPPPSKRLRRREAALRPELPRPG